MGFLQNVEPDRSEGFGPGYCWVLPLISCKASEHLFFDIGLASIGDPSLSTR